MFLKVEDSSKIIAASIRGFIKNNICYIEKLIVHPDYQNKGLGTKLLTDLENKFDYVEKYELYTGYVKKIVKLDKNDKLYYSDYSASDYESVGYAIIIEHEFGFYTTYSNLENIVVKPQEEI